MMSDDELLEFDRKTANGIVAKLNAARRDSVVTSAIEVLLSRIVGAGNSLHTLRNYAPHEYAPDGGMILRGTYDAMIQALYILSDSTEQEARAQLYLDYFWVEKKETIELLDTSPTLFGKQMSNSPRRASAEQAIEERFQSVCGRFRNRNKSTFRKHWYAGDLRVLAAALGLESEYLLLHKHLSGIVHSSAYALKEGMPIQGFLLLSLAWRFSYRVLGKFSEYANITLENHERERIRLAQGNIFGDSNAF